MPDTNSTGSSGVPMNNRKVPVNSRAAARENLRASETSALSEGRGFRANIDAGDWVEAPIDDSEDLENGVANSSDEEIPDSGNSMAGSTVMNRAPDDDSYDEYYDDDEPMFGLEEDAGENDNTPWRKRHSGDDDEEEDSKDASNNQSAKDDDEKKSGGGRKSGDESGGASSSKKKSKSSHGGSSSSSSEEGSSAKKANDAEKGGFYKPSGDKGAREGGKAGKAAAAAGAVAEAAGAKGAGKLSGFKKKGPIMAIIALLGGLGFGVASSQLLMPFHVVEQLTEMFDGSYTARHSRSATILRYMFNLENENTTVIRRFGKSKYRADIKPDSKLAKKLSAQGIEVKTNGKKSVLVHNGVEIDADSFTKTYRENPEFRNDFNRGTRGIVGRIAAYIDLTLARFLDNHTLTKNLFKKWINSVYDAEGQTTTFHQIITDRYPKTGGTTRAQSEYEYDTEETYTKDDGTTGTRTEEHYPKTDETTEGISGGGQSKVAEYANAIAGAAQVATSAVCAYGAISATLAALKMATAFDNARRYFSNVAESVDKVKAGDGEASPIYASGLDLSEKADGKSALESEGMKLVISGGEYNPKKDDSHVQAMNIQDTFKEFGSSIKFVLGCAVASGIVSFVSVVLDVMSIGTFSVGKAIFGAAIGVGIAALVSGATNQLMKFATTDLCTSVAGAGRGECIALGASNYTGTNFQNGGGTLADRSKVNEFYDAHVLALAEEAELDRSTRSPFDLTTSHTFLGSIAGKLSIIASTMSGTNLLSGLSNLAMSSMTKLLPTASALNKMEYLEHQVGDCESLSDINAVGNIYCEPIRIIDMTYVDKDPEENLVKLADKNQFKTGVDGNIELDENGVEVIDPDSKLGRYISFCSNRTSPFGTMDANIQAQFNKAGVVETGNGGLDTVLNSVVNSLPAIGGIFDMINGTSTLLNVGWISGANCVARNGGTTLSGEYDDGSGSIKTTTIDIDAWDDTMKEAQLYVADDRYAQNSSSNYKSAVIAYLERQDAENPSDGTYAEWLAKQTGILKEDVQVALNEEAYWYYVAQYNPEGKGPMFNNEIKPETNYQMPENEIANDYNERISTVKAWVVYSDSRIQEVTA